jgi:arsenite methyltransferase
MMNQTGESAMSNPSNDKTTVKATVRVFDPPMCCSTGVCGSVPDMALARFSADLHWLERQGVTVERFNLSQQPERFVNEQAVLKVLQAGGAAVLPLVMVDGQIVFEGAYPSREELAQKLDLPVTASLPLVTVAKAGGCCSGSNKCG